MAQTSREIVKDCLTFTHPERIPRQLWSLPWAEQKFPETMQELNIRFPGDFNTADYFYPPASKTKGDPYKKGYYTDEWGCIFYNLQNGIIGEVREPTIKDIADWNDCEPPYEQIPKSKLERLKMYDRIRRFCQNSDLFVMANINPRPWERYQFLRGSENALIDIMMPEQGAKKLLQKIHDFYLYEIELWVKSDVDAISFMDDWGAQNQLLIAPELWREMFKPLYKDYCDLAKAEGKFAFMHSDGYIQDIYLDLIEIGVDAINSQLFCMDFDYLERYAKGKITFWGEIDRQHILPDPDPQAGRNAVRQIARHLYDRQGGIIAQLEFGPGANPQTVLAAFEEWEFIQNQDRNSEK